jgi:hypothetical protein
MKLIVALAAAALLSAPSIAAPCKDAKGKFIKCPPAAAAAAPAAGITKDKNGRCHAAGGKFVKCPK